MFAHGQLRVAAAGAVGYRFRADAVKQNKIAGIELAVLFAGHDDGIFDQIVRAEGIGFFRQHFSAVAVEMNGAGINIVEVADAQFILQIRVIQLVHRVLPDPKLIQGAALQSGGVGMRPAPVGDRRRDGRHPHLQGKGSDPLEAAARPANGHKTDPAVEAIAFLLHGGRHAELGADLRIIRRGFFGKWFVLHVDHVHQQSGTARQREPLAEQRQGRGAAVETGAVEGPVVQPLAIRGNELRRLRIPLQRPLQGDDRLAAGCGETEEAKKRREKIFHKNGQG